MSNEPNFARRGREILNPKLEILNKLEKPMIETRQMQNKANPWAREARNCGLGIGDWGFEPVVVREVRTSNAKQSQFGERDCFGASLLAMTGSEP